MGIRNFIKILIRDIQDEIEMAKTPIFNPKKFIIESSEIA